VGAAAEKSNNAITHPCRSHHVRAYPVSSTATPRSAMTATAAEVPQRSAATVGEGTQNLLCGYLAVAVLVGGLANGYSGMPSPVRE
jgi:hypothetical protein